MKNKIILRLIAGLLVSSIIIFLLFYIFLILNPGRIHEVNFLKWIPLLILGISMYISGRINKSTPAKWLPILILPIVLLKPFRYFYFPFILVSITVSCLMLLASRPKIKYHYLASVGAFLLFLWFLFQQPLIIEKDNFGYDSDGKMVNAFQLWGSNSNIKTPLPSHSLMTMEGEDFELSSLKGKTYFITFWATWCAPCLQDKPVLETLKSNYQGDKNISFIDISFDEKRTAWNDFISKTRPKGTQLISDDAKLTSRKLNFNGLPMHLLVDKNGTYQKYRNLEDAIIMLGQKEK